MVGSRELKGELSRIGSGYSGTWTAAVTDLKSGVHIAIDEDAIMPTASLIKVPVLVALYRAARDGKLALADRTTYEQAHYCRGSGVLQHMTPGVEMSVRDAAMLMIVISDNAATNMCIDLVGLDEINNTMGELGLHRTHLLQRLGDSKAGLDARKMSVSSAGDMCALLTLIARHEAVSAEASDDMLWIMRRLNGRAELSRELPWTEMNMLPNPRENWVAEKGGSFINGIRTGGAIFHSEKGHFAMAVFCEGGTSGRADHDAEGNRIVGALGKAAWDALC